MPENRYYSKNRNLAKKKKEAQKKKRVRLALILAGVVFLVLIFAGAFGGNREKEDMNRVMQENTELKLKIADLEAQIAQMQSGEYQDGEVIILDPNEDIDPPNNRVTEKPKATAKPTAKPTAKATVKPTEKPKATAKATATAKPTEKATAKPTAKATEKPTEKPAEKTQTPGKTATPSKE